MAFCTFSKDFNENGYTLVENRFISKYLPEANDFAVKVYLYGLYLCQKGGDAFTSASMAELFGISEQRLIDAFLYWQDYDLVEILSKSPLTVQYLPIAGRSKPKKVRYEKYTDFNKELQRKLQKAGKFVGYQDAVKYMNFLEETELQPTAFLLIVDYAIMKKGVEVTGAYIFNKAKKLIAEGYTTFEQVERALGNYNENEKYISELFKILSINKKTDEKDYALYEKWLTAGFEKGAIASAARHLKKGTMNTLSGVLEILAEKQTFKAREVTAYLTKRETMLSLTYRIARKLGVKISAPDAYIDEYVEKWTGQGFNETALLDIALYCLKTDRGDFGCMNDLLQKLLTAGIKEETAVKDYLKEKNSALRLLAKIRNHIGGVKSTEANLELVTAWKSWGFTEEMIVEGAKRSTASAAPMPYLNKILEGWKAEGLTTPAELAKEGKKTVAPVYQNAAVAAADAKTEREKFYAERRAKAQSLADKFFAEVNKNARFKELGKALSRMELSLAKAELYSPDALPKLQAEQRELQAERQELLAGMGIEEWQLQPQWSCKKCSDTGYIANGASCDCYGK